jgi:hypothetical protein
VGGSAGSTRAPRFHEVQRFRQVWLWAILIGIAVMQWWGFIEQIILGRPWGNRPAPDWMMWVLLLAFGIGLPWAFYAARLVTTVDAEGISVRFWPFYKRTIPFSEIESAAARRYNPIREYGGWGIRGWTREKMALSTVGRDGVELTLKDGQHLMVGSGRAQELAQAILLSSG